MSFHDSIFDPTPPYGLPPKPPTHWLPPTPPSHGSPPTPTPSGYFDFTAHDTIQGHTNPGFGSGNNCCNRKIGHNYEYFGQKNDVLHKYNMEIQRHLEKGRIREEIIAGEIAWRRVLEAEVREELRMERERALELKGGNAFDISRVPLGKSFLQELEKMIEMCVEERLRVRGGFETSGANSLPFQRINVESGVKEADNPKERIIFVSKPDANPSGKAKQVLSPAKESAKKAAPGVGRAQSKPDANPSGKAKQVLSPAKESAKKAAPGVGRAQEKKMWVCKSKEADQKCTNIALGVLPKETSQAVSTITPVPSLPQEPKINQSKPPSLHTVGRKDSDKKGVPSLPIIEEKDTVVLKVKEKKSFIYWCEMCNVRVEHEKLKEDHLNGKRHLKMLRKRTNIGLEVSPKVATSQPISTTTLVPSPPQINQIKPLSLHILCTKDSDGNGVSNLPKIEEKESEVLKIKEKKSTTFYCEMCKVRAEHEKVKGAHLKGKKHLKKLQTITFYCEMCKVRAEHEDVKEAHLKGKKHLKMLRKNIPAKLNPNEGSLDIMSALQLVLKKSRAHGGLARGLHECAKAIENNAARLCVLAEDCDPDYDKLVKAFCADHSVSVISAPSCITLGEWAGMCDMDGDEGNARNVVACSCVVVKDNGEEPEGLNIVQEYVKSHSTHSLP